MKKATKIATLIATVNTAVLAAPFTVLAKAPWEPTEGTTAGSLNDLIRILLNTGIIMAAVVAVIYLIINGIKYMTSSGDSQKTEEAQKGISNALIGLIICLAAALVVNFVLAKLGTTAKPID